MGPEVLPKAPLWYWLVPAALIAFGTIAAASIGLPLLAFGIYLVLREIKGRPRRQSWPPIIGMVLFLASFWGIGYLFGPLSCSTIFNVRQEIGPAETEPRTTIDNTRTTCASPFLPKKKQGRSLLTLAGPLGRRGRRVRRRIPHWTRIGGWTNRWERQGPMKAKYAINCRIVASY